LWQTVFVDVDLSVAKGLETVEHLGPSHIGLDSIYLSKGSIPATFLRGCGVPENLITYAQSEGARENHPLFCTVSYSIRDRAFAKKLHDQLEENGVRCWLAPEDLKTGDRFHIRIDEATKVYNKWFLILSENSLESSWIEGEIDAVIDRERKQKNGLLTLIRLDQAVLATRQAWAVDLRRTRTIRDLSEWENEKQFMKAFAELLASLNAEKTKPA
jgi:hypothetical protein